MDLKKVFEDIMTFHRGKLIGVTLGLIFGLFTIIFTFWSALFLAVCIFIGFFLGRRIDDDKDFKELIKKFWSGS